MCGVAAIFSRDGDLGPVDQQIETLLLHMQPRGPDRAAWGAWPGCVLGCVRLRIMDLRPSADQPMSGPARRAHVVFNGEIFNQLDIRAQLQPPAAGWRTTSDTETLVSAYEQHGDAIVKELEGQFAFAIFDAVDQKLVLGRDRFGICPLYVAEVGSLVVVASSVRAILAAFPGKFRRASRSGLQQYLLLRYTLAPHTLVEGIRQIGPGEIAVFERRTTRLRRYWAFGHERPVQVDPDGGVPELAHALESAVADTCRSDAEVGLFLSGGVDSGVVAALTRRYLPKHPCAATISFAGSGDEEAAAATDLARQLGYRHVITTVGPESDDVEMIEELVAALDVPCAARDNVATHMLARALRRAEPDVKVVLTGTGADELFGGYRSAYFGAADGSIAQQIGTYLQLYSAINARERPLLRSLLPALDEAWLVSELEARARAIFPSLDPADPGRVLDVFYLITHLPGWELHINDVLCMNQSLEARVPFLHSRVAAVAMRLPSAPVAHTGGEKMVLRHTARRWLAADACARPKVPLSRPVAIWLDRCRTHIPWRPAVLADLGLEATVLRCMFTGKLSFDIWWRLFLLDRWVARHLSS